MQLRMRPVDDDDSCANGFAGRRRSVWPSLYGHHQPSVILRERCPGNQEQERTTKRQTNSHLCLRGIVAPPSVDGEIGRRLSNDGAVSIYGTTHYGGDVFSKPEWPAGYTGQFYRTSQRA